jgi:tRNA G18 (ribose-2'-O)-methylase SpoU
MVPVGDASDPRLADYVRLTDVHLRRSLEAPSGLFVAEGEKVIRRAIGAGYPVRSLLITEDKLAGHADLAGSCPGPVYLVEPEVAEQVTGYRVHRGALASMQRLPLPSVADVTARARRIVVLEDIVDHTNVGAIFRCVAALGFDAVVLAPRCADPLYRRSVRVSMGAVFTVPYARMADWREGLGELRSAGFRLLALTPAPDAVPIGDVPASRCCSGPRETASRPAGGIRPTCRCGSRCAGEWTRSTSPRRRRSPATCWRAAGSRREAWPARILAPRCGPGRAGPRRPPAGCRRCAAAPAGPDPRTAW